MKGLEYEVGVTRCVRRAGRLGQWARHSHQTERFESEEAAREFVRSLGKTRTPMYRDNLDGSSRRVGWVVHSKELEDGCCYYVEWWCEITKVERELVSP
jgi:hypothetical protein